MKGSRTARTVPVLVSVLAAGLAAGGCGGDAKPPQRGFGSRQLVASSDSTLTLYGFVQEIGSSMQADGGRYYFSTTNLDRVWYGTGDGTAAQAFWSLDLRTGASEPLGPMLPDLVIPPPEPAPGTLECEQRVVAGERTLFITDPASGTETVIESVTSLSRCPTQTDRTIQVVREDQAGRGRLWTGPYDALEQAPLGISIAQVVSRGGGQDRMVVLSDSDDAPGAWRIDEISLASLTVTTLVPASLTGAAWANGASETTLPLESDRLVEGNVRAAGAGTFAFQRAMSDGRVIMFLGPFMNGPARELALFPVRGNALPVMLTATPNGGPLTGSFDYQAWIDVDADPQAASTLHLWDGARQRITSCPVPGDVGRDLGGRILPWANAVVFDVASSIGERAGPLLLYLGDQDGPLACRLLAAGGASQVTWSPESLAWRENDGGEESSLRAIRYDGSEPRLIGTGWLQYPHFVDSFDLQFFFGSDLVGVDLREDPVRLKYLAEGVYGSFLNWGVSIITGYGYNTQDGTGSLGVVNRLSGERRLISGAVDAFLLGYRPAEAAVDVVYRVRGRNPSGQDGIWVATISYDQLD